MLALGNMIKLFKKEFVVPCLISKMDRTLGNGRIRAY